jgi:hypothetical protein
MNNFNLKLFVVLLTITVIDFCKKDKQTNKFHGLYFKSYLRRTIFKNDK